MNKLIIKSNPHKYLEDDNLSLNAKGLLTILLTNEKIEQIDDVSKFCSNSQREIMDTLFELKANKYIRVNPKTKLIEKNTEPYQVVYKNNNLEL